jgi:hypothetical protein
VSPTRRAWRDIDLVTSNDRPVRSKDQTLASGKTLRAEIQQRLAGYTYPPHMPDLAATLAGIRKMITDTARFSPELQRAITNSLAPAFEPGRNLRFRSSTNLGPR